LWQQSLHLFPGVSQGGVLLQLSKTHFLGLV
jgi:hypothetical protein